MFPLDTECRRGLLYVITMFTAAVTIDGKFRLVSSRSLYVVPLYTAAVTTDGKFRLAVQAFRPGRLSVAGIARVFAAKEGATRAWVCAGA